ncbi:hypothetical protein [Streptomyces sp. 8N616]|uniref:hypothetical protein n=1 Tax=Streptomyces sp. 8N616 TaxID=3457414 RepID=UPI003FD13C97
MSACWPPPGCSTASFQEQLDVSTPRAWEPAAAAYRYATDRLAVDPAETLLVAVHPWDVDGARRAGFGGGETPVVAREIQEFVHVVG